MDADSVAVSAVTYAEVVHGVLNSHPQKFDRAVALFEQLPVLPFDRLAALRYGALPFRRGRFDRLIAAHALSIGAVLVTNDPADFESIADLRIENWAQ